MKATENGMLHRRMFLAAVAGASAAGAVAVAGCLDSENTPDGTVLTPPENYDALLETDTAYPIHGEPLPTVELYDAVRERTVDVEEFFGSRHVLMTFIFTDCSGACPALESTLVHAQADAAEKSYGDDVALIAITFDPDHDTPEVLREYGESIGVDYTMDNWYFLRPESEDRAKQVVQETYGQHYSRNPPEAMMRFDHLPLMILANEDGVVERSYANEPPATQDVLADLRKLVDGG